MPKKKLTQAARGDRRRPDVRPARQGRGAAVSDNEPSIAPLCTCVDRGEPDWNGAHDAACPWLAWKSVRPSIAELQRSYGEGGATLAVLDAAPVLLEIVAAAKELEGELIYLQGPLSECLRAALAKVRR